MQSLEEEIEKEKEELNKSKISQEASIRKLKTELSGTKQKLQETEVSNCIYFLSIYIPVYHAFNLPHPSPFYHLN